MSSDSSKKFSLPHMGGNWESKYSKSWAIIHVAVQESLAHLEQGVISEKNNEALGDALKVVEETRDLLMKLRNRDVDGVVDNLSK